MNNHRQRLDGRKLAAMVDERLRLDEVPARVMGASFARALNRWRNGECPLYEDADPYLVPLAIYEWDIPDECWVENWDCRVTPLDVRAKAVAMYEETGSAADAARRFNVSPRSVVRWAREQNLKAAA